MKKIDSLKLKKWISMTLLSLGIIIPIPLLIVNSLSNTKNIVLGNYQSYMDPYVTAPELTKKYGVSFDYFETAEDAKRLLRGNTIDISNTTSYEMISLIQEGLIQKLDWNIFNLTHPITGDKITNSTEAMDLFIPATHPFLTVDIDVDGNPETNLLDYGIPYFLQDLSFVYRGDEISNLATPTVNWSDVLTEVGQDQRFRPTNLPKLVALNDSRTMYSIPRTIQTAPTNNVNPNPTASINELQNTYQILANSLNQAGSHSIALNSDSNAVLNMVAANQANGGFMFNGDAVFAASGGDDALEIDETDFHCVKPVDTVVALDLLVVNQKLKTEDYTKVHEILKELVLNDGEFDPDNINEASLTYNNFDFVNYTPPLKVLYDYVTTLDNYFDSEWQIDMVKIDNVETSQIEKPIPNLLKSDFNFAWIGFRNSLK